MLTAWNHVRAIALLPVMNVIVIPAIVLTISGAGIPRIAGASAAQVVASVLGLVLLTSGLVLVARSIAMLVSRGHGTLAPWDPPQRLVVGDVYAHCRNPMKAGLFLTLIGESVVANSIALAGWAVVFVLVNLVYVRLFEERGLRARFGASYASYCARVPRWWPRLRIVR